MLRFEIPEQKTFTHQMVIAIRWGDMDAMGHVNNAVYFRYLETLRMHHTGSGRLAWRRRLGVDPQLGSHAQHQDRKSVG